LFPTTLNQRKKEFSLFGNSPILLILKCGKVRFSAALDRKEIIGIGKRPDPEIIGFLRRKFTEENGGKLGLQNIRIVCEALKCTDSAKNIIDTCALKGVHSLHLTQVESSLVYR